LNANSKTATHGVNEFADLTDEEFNTRLGLHPKGLEGREDKYEERAFDIDTPLADLPKSLDWRDAGVVGSPKDQKSCGSCWTFAATGSVEINCHISSGKEFILSEQELVDCAKEKYDDKTYWDCNGCKGGWMSAALQYNHEHIGQSLEDDYPYTALDHDCDFNNAINNDHYCHARDVFNFPENDVVSFRNAIQEGAVSIGVSTVGWKSYFGGIMSAEECHGEITHGVVAMGYGHDDELDMDYWLIRNSWGPRWGESGFVRVQRDFENFANNGCNSAEINSYARVPAEE